MNEPEIRARPIWFPSTPRWLRNSLMIIIGLLVVGALVWYGRTLTASNASVSWQEMFAGIEHDWPGVPQIDTAELERRVSAEEENRPFLIDVRSREEYNVSHLPGAVRADSPSQIRLLARTTPPKRPLVLYCSVGIRSSIAAEKLIEEGYTNVFNLRGSIFKWANEGRLLVRNGKPVHRVHPYNTFWGQLLDQTYHPK